MIHMNIIHTVESTIMYMLHTYYMKCVSIITYSNGMSYFIFEDN